MTKRTFRVLSQFTLATIIMAGGGCASRTLPATSEASCNTVPEGGSLVLPMPGSPNVAHATRDGCWLFITMAPGPEMARRPLALYRKEGNSFVLHYFAQGSGGIGMALTKDESTVVVTMANRIFFHDVAKLKAQDSTALRGELRGDLTGAQRIMPVFSHDDRFLFVANEAAASITVIDMGIVRERGYTDAAILGHLKTGAAPVAIAFSRDNKHIFTTSQAAPPSTGWPNVCRAEADTTGSTPDRALGAILVFNYERATTAPNSAEPENIVPAGCNPVRLVTDAAGERVYVTARGTDELLVFDAERLTNRSANALVASVPIGPDPVGLALVNNGHWAAVTSSNRFNATPADTQAVWFVDVSKVERGREAVLGSIRAGAFPRHLKLMPDGRTLVISNYLSRTLQFIDLSTVKLRAR